MAQPQASVFNLAPRRPKVRNKEDVDPDLLTVEHNFKPPAHRVFVGSKYAEKFGALKPMSAIRCEKAEAGPISIALNAAIKLDRYPAIAGCKARHCTMPDGSARVWAEPVKATA